MFKGAVVSAFSVFGETASGQLAAAKVIGDTLAANPFTLAGFIGAIAFFQIFGFMAFHSNSPLSEVAKFTFLIGQSILNR